MAATVTGIHLGPDTHANRPAADAPPVGAFYYCSDHDLIYITDGSSWSTWADNSGGGGGDITADDAWVAKGDLIGGTGEDTAGIVSVGANGSHPIADSGETAGIRWIKNNIGATAAPDADNDVDEGYEPGSRWVDTTNDKEYVCLDATDGAAVWTETTQSGSGSSISDYLYTAPGSEDAISVEWAGSDLSGFTQLDETGEDGHVTWTEAAGMLSLHHDGTDGTAEFHAVVKSIGALSHPASFVTAITYHGAYSTNYNMCGIVLADGAVHGSGNQVVGIGFEASGTGGLSNQLRQLTGFDTSVDVASGTIRSPKTLFLRIRWTAANTFYLDTSPDGINWIEEATNSATFTPTHFGIAASTYGGSAEFIDRIHFLRAYDDS